MLMIRFQRIGRKNDPAFRIAVLEKTAGPKAGKYVDLVGTYNPKTKVSTVQSEKIKEWMSKGAQLSPSVSNLLIGLGVIEGKKAQLISKKNLEKNVAKRKAEEEAVAEAARVAAQKVADDEAAAKAAKEAAEAAPVEAAPETPAEEIVSDVPPSDHPPLEEAPSEAADAA